MDPRMNEPLWKFSWSLVEKEAGDWNVHLLMHVFTPRQYSYQGHIHHEVVDFHVVPYPSVIQVRVSRFGHPPSRRVFP